MPDLTLSTYELTVDADNADVQQVIVSDSRGAAAEGKTVMVTFDGLLPVSSRNVTLGANGTGSVDFGPSPFRGGPLEVIFQYETGEATEAALSLSFV